ncbi:MAG: dTMP kinase [Candidatus Rokuibacteriota bacterium]
MAGVRVSDRSGRLITIEGVEGSGKSTQVVRLADWLRGLGLPVATTAEPDGTPLGIRVRELLAALPALDPLAECCLFAAARAEHVRRVIRPALDRDTTVLSDRFVDSTTAYQGYGRGVDLEIIAGLNRLATDGLVPDLTVILDLDVTEGLRRVQRRGRALGGAPDRPLQRDPFEGLGVEFHERVRKGYWAIRERVPERVVIVAADQSEDAVGAAVRGVVAARLGLGRPR